MDITIHPGKLHGTVKAIPSKSHAHRVLICAAFANKETTVLCKETNEDIEATADCLRALGAGITATDYGYFVVPIKELPANARLNCRESGSTLRFILPIVGALGVDTTISMAGRLPERPLSPLWEEMERMGCKLDRPSKTTVHCTGKLQPGKYAISGGISSQFITGLLFALSLIDGTSELQIIGKLESAPYVNITKKVLQDFGVTITDKVIGSFPFSSPGSICIEGDWSNSAFFYAAEKMGSNVKIAGLNQDSPQGDRAVVEILQQLDAGYTEISVADIPDLVPILAVCAATKHGAAFRHIQRLRLKESDRVATVCAMLEKFGAKCATTEDTLTVRPAAFQGCTIDAAGDHRIAMAAAIGATVAADNVKILGAQCVSKSYPSFWEVYKQLGGNYEQHIR